LVETSVLFITDPGNVGTLGGLDYYNADIMITTKNSDNSYGRLNRPPAMQRRSRYNAKNAIV
jgi:hypothetical protein